MRPRVLMLPTAYAHGTLGAPLRSLAIAHALAARGAEVAFVCGGYPASLIAAEGYPVYACPMARGSRAAVPILSALDSLGWTGLAAPDLVAALVEAELAAIKAFKPDVTWADFRPTAAISAAVAGVPLAAIANWPTHPAFPPNVRADPGAGVFNSVLRRYRLPVVSTSLELVYIRSQLRLAPTLSILEPELAAAVPDAVFLGHTIDLLRHQTVPDWFATWAGERPGFAYLSVTGLDPATYAMVLKTTFAGTPYRVACATGFRAGGFRATVGPEQDSAEVRFVDFVPALPTIARCRFVISHAGLGTVLASLFCGVPSLLVPGEAAEREYNANRLADLGAGIVLPIKGFRPTRIAAALETLLGGPHRSVAEELSRALHAAGGCELAADRILALAGRLPQGPARDLDMSSQRDAPGR